MSDLTFTIEQLSDHEVVSLLRTGPYDQSAPQAWNDLWAWVGKNSLSENVRRVIGFGLDDPRTTPRHDIRYRANLVLHNMPDIEDNDEGVIVITLSGGPYAVHRMVGPYTGMPETFGNFKEAVAAAGHEFDFTRPFLELYINSPDTAAPNELITDLCIPVQS